MSNVIVFMSDEHNPRYSSPYGHDFVDTPNMQWLADRGTTFEHAYCPSPLCVPSRSAFLTGKRVHAIRAYGNNRLGIAPETRGLGAVLGEQGVHTVFIGKVHAYRPVAELGFSETIETYEGAWEFDEAQRRRPLAVRPGGAKRLDAYGPREAPWGNDVTYMNAAVEWLRTRAAGIDRPWVLYVNLVKPHFPHFCTEALWDQYRDHGDLPAYGVEAETAQHPYAVDLRRHFGLEERRGTADPWPAPRLLRVRQLYRRAARAAAVGTRGIRSREHHEPRVHLRPRRDVGQIRPVVEVQPA